MTAAKRILALLIFALLVPAAAHAQTQRPGGSDRPLPTVADIPRLDLGSLDAATLERVTLLLSGIHGAPDRATLEAQVPQAREVLVAVALEPDALPFQRGQALAALAQWQDEGVRATFEAILGDAAQDEILRHRALLLLGRTFGDSAVAVIAPFLSHSDVQWRLSAATALGEIDSDAALDALDEAASRETDPVVLARIERASLHVR